MARYRCPAVIVIDLQISAPSGMDTARAIRSFCPHARTVLISLLVGPEYVDESWRAGACGFVSSDAAQSDLGPAIRNAFEGKFFVSPGIQSGR